MKPRMVAPVAFMTDPEMAFRMPPPPPTRNPASGVLVTISHEMALNPLTATIPRMSDSDAATVERLTTISTRKDRSSRCLVFRTPTSALPS